MRSHPPKTKAFFPIEVIEEPPPIGQGQGERCSIRNGLKFELKEMVLIKTVNVADIIEM